MALLTLALLPLAATAAITKAPTMPSGFSGLQSGIGSWYQADTSRDSTNGHSWCGYPYTDNSPVFAPSLATMGGKASGPEYETAIKAYCGLEAKVTDSKTGKSMLLYVGDSFAQPRTPGSIDIMLSAFSSLNGSPSGDKDTVIQGVTWELTGNINTQFAAKGAGSRSLTGATTGAGGSSPPATTPAASAGGEGSGSSSKGGNGGKSAEPHSSFATSVKKGSSWQTPAPKGSKSGKKWGTDPKKWEKMF